VVEHEFDLE
jgi:hypothetical protein